MSFGKNISVFGIFDSRLHAEKAINALKDDGFRSADISCLVPENSGNKELGTQKETKAPEGAAVGTSTGAVIGGTIGWLVGAGTLFIPGVGPFLAAGPIMAALAGAGVGGTVGGVAGSMVGAGIPEYVATRYTGSVAHGKVLLSVHCDTSEWANRATQILKNEGGEDIDNASESSNKVVEGTSTERPYSRNTTRDMNSVL